MARRGRRKDTFLGADYSVQKGTRVPRHTRAQGVHSIRAVRARARLRVVGFAPDLLDLGGNKKEAYKTEKRT